MSEEIRRKLRLLPEVLPDPLLNRDRTTGPRDRTLSHMQRLFATAAAATAAASGGCGDKADAPKPEPSATAASTTATTTASVNQSDPVPPHTATAEVSSSAQTGADPRFPPDAGDDAGVKKTLPPKPPPPPPTHYMVVDPVPQPFVQPPPKPGTP